MNKVAIRLAVGFAVSAVIGCTEGSRPPTTPSGHVELAAANGVIDWSCARLGAAKPSSGGGLWVFAAASQPCVGGMIAVTSTGADVSGPPPSNFRSTVTGNTVRLDWDYTGTGDGFQIEAGSSPGLSNLASARVPRTGPVSNFAVFGGVPAGSYHVRVRAFDSASVGVPSPDIVVQVGGAGPGCTGAPGPPGTPTSTVSGNNVTVFWTAPSGSAPSSYFIEAGTASGLSNAAAFDTGSTALSLSATAPNGRYFVRVRGRNACGTGPTSGEHVLDVGGSGPPPPPPPPVGQCPTSLSPQSQAVPGAGGPFQIIVNAPPTCAWSATTTEPWIVISSGSGVGTGPLNYAVQPNGATTRTGQIRVSGTSMLTATVTQDPAVASPQLQAAFTVSADPCPIVRPNPNQNPRLNCTFNGSTSTGAIASYEWTFGTFKASSQMVTNLVVECGFPPGEFLRDLTLTVRNAQGSSSSVTHAISFRNDSGC